MRLLHTSDWHIGRQFHNVSLLEDQAHVLDQLVDIIKQKRIDVVLIAGDIYDRSVPPAAAVSLLNDVLERICIGLKIPIILIAGNHDSPERLGFASRQLADTGLYIFGRLQPEFTPVVLNDTYGEIAFYGIPYFDPVVARQLFQTNLSSHDEAMAFIHDQIEFVPKRRNIVLSHVFLAGGESSESERPLSVGGLDTVSAETYKKFDYAALGHLHGRQFKGAETIRYSGSILKYSFSEVNQIKSVAVIEMDKEGKCSIDQIPLIPKRDMRILEGELQTILDQGQSDPQKEDYFLVRLTDTHAILDIMNKLREVYPNVLHLERPGLMAAADQSITVRDHLQRNEFNMFEDFFQQIAGAELNQEQAAVVQQTLKFIHDEEEDSP